MEISEHKKKYRNHHFKYSSGFKENRRIIPNYIKFNILFAGIATLISIIFMVTGLIPFFTYSSVGIPDFSFIIVLIFPVIGIIMLYFSLKKNIKYLRIIKTGKLAYGTFLRFESTNVKINNRRVYRYFFEFSDANQKKYMVAGQTHTERLSDETQELLVYNPLNPNEAVMVDELPQNVKKFLLYREDNDKNINLIPYSNSVL